MTTLDDLCLIIVFPQFSYRKGGGPAIGPLGRSNRDSSFRPTSRGGSFPGKCHHCGFYGHKMEFCRLPEATSFNSNTNKSSNSGSGSGAGGSKGN